MKLSLHFKSKCMRSFKLGIRLKKLKKTSIRNLMVIRPCLRPSHIIWKITQLDSIMDFRNSIPMHNQRMGLTPNPRRRKMIFSQDTIRMRQRMILTSISEVIMQMLMSSNKSQCNRFSLSNNNHSPVRIFSIFLAAVTQCLNNTLNLNRKRML